MTSYSNNSRPTLDITIKPTSQVKLRGVVENDNYSITSFNSEVTICFAILNVKISWKFSTNKTKLKSVLLKFLLSGLQVPSLAVGPLVKNEEINTDTMMGQRGQPRQIFVGQPTIFCLLSVVVVLLGLLATIFRLRHTRNKIES